MGKNIETIRRLPRPPKIRKGQELAILGKALQNKLKKAKEALKLADSIMDYVSFDKWEKEATAEDRAKFDKLYAEVF